MAKDLHDLSSAVKANETILASLQVKTDTINKYTVDLLTKVSEVSASLETHKEHNAEFHASLLEKHREMLEKYEKVSDALAIYNMHLQKHIHRTEVVEINHDILKSIVEKCEVTIAKNSEALAKQNKYMGLALWVTFAVLATMTIMNPDAVPFVTRMIQLIANLL